METDDIFEIENIEDFIDDLESLEPQFDSEFSELEPLDDGTVIDFDMGSMLYIPKCILSAGQIVNLIRRMLRDINPYYIDLAERTAYCAVKVYDYAVLKEKKTFNIDRGALILLSVLFTIGAYRDDINSAGSGRNETFDIFLYSYLYLKHLTPLKDIAESILFYSYNWEKAKALGTPYYEYASLIFTCMRICIELRKTGYKNSKNILSDAFVAKCGRLYDPKYIKIFFDANQNDVITNALKDNSSFYMLDEYCNSLNLDYEETFALLKLLIYAVDFVSTSTVTHIISTAFHATEISLVEGLSDSETDEEFTAAVLHDLGKMGIEVEILESSGKLTPEQMERMRQHVLEGDRLYRGIAGDKLSDIATRHHETLDGTGYPYGLTAKELTIQQRILSIADILSALTDARTYKPSFPKAKTLEILSDMAAKKRIDPAIFEKIKENYDRIMNHTEARRPMLTVNFAGVVLDYMRLQDIKNIPELYAAIHE